MRGIPFLFIATGSLFLLAGMVWGIQMSMSHDHMLSPAHAHLNLLGFVLFMAFGLFYHVVPEAGETLLARVHYALALAGVVIVVPGIVMALRETGEALAAIGSLLTLASALTFFVVVLRSRRAVGTGGYVPA